MKTLTLLLVLILLTACTSRSGQRERETKTVVQSLISTDEGVQTEPYIKLIGKLAIKNYGRVAVIEIEGKRYIMSPNGEVVVLR